MTDPVQRLREALAEYERSLLTANRAVIGRAGGVLTGSARTLLDALPTMLQAAKADGWDEGVCYVVDMYDPEPYLRSNPYRVAAADELARETREQES